VLVRLACWTTVLVIVDAKRTRLIFVEVSVQKFLCRSVFADMFMHDEAAAFPINMMMILVTHSVDPCKVSMVLPACLLLPMLLLSTSFIRVCFDLCFVASLRVTGWLLTNKFEAWALGPSGGCSLISPLSSVQPRGLEKHGRCR
jgi:hypothetical protein